MRASGLRPRAAASSADISTGAAAPSEMFEEEAAVITPSLPNAARRSGIFADVDLARLLVGVDHDLALAGLDRHRDDFVVERARWPAPPARASTLSAR